MGPGGEGRYPAESPPRRAAARPSLRSVAGFPRSLGRRLSVPTHLEPRTSHASDDHRLRTLARPRAWPGPRHARALGAGGSRPALRGAPAVLRGDAAAGASGAPSFRPDPHLRAGRAGAVRVRRDRAAHRPDPSGPAARGSRRQAARGVVDVRRAQHDRAAGVRACAVRGAGAADAVVRRASGDAGQARTPAPGRAVPSSGPKPVARRRIQRRRPADAQRAAAGAGHAAAGGASQPGRIPGVAPRGRLSNAPSRRRPRSSGRRSRPRPSPPPRPARRHLARPDAAETTHGAQTMRLGSRTGPNSCSTAVA